MIAVPKDTPGIRIGRTPHVFGYDHAGGHPEVIYEDVRVPVDNLLGEEGGGFAISQARLGPGRIHHCMRSIGVAERALGLMVDRALQRTTFGTSVAHKGLIQDWIAESRIEIDMCREYVLRTAHLMDTVGNKAAATEISGIKVAVPNMALKVIDRAIQVHGAAGVTQFTPLAAMYASMRTLRIADGPDEVHKMTIARREILRHDPSFRMNPARGHRAPAPTSRSRSPGRDGRRGRRRPRGRAPAARRRHDPRRERTPQRLIAAARVVFERDGFHDARLSDVTREAKVSTGTLYNYFQSKEELFRAVMQGVLDDLTARPTTMPAASRATAVRDPVSGIFEANRSYVQGYRRNARLMSLLTQVAERDAEVLAIALAIRQHFEDRISRAIRRWQADGLAYSDLDPVYTANALAYMVDRFLHEWSALGLDYDEDKVADDAQHAVGPCPRARRRPAAIRPELDGHR